MTATACDGCGVSVRLSDLSQADDGDTGETSPALCLVCVYPEFYTYGPEQLSL